MSQNNGQHTPGPWVLEYPAPDGYYGRSLSRRVLIHRGGLSRYPIMEADEGTLSPANARLIAAAPELLVELQHLVRLLGPWEDAIDVPGFATLNGARAAIAKALGESEAASP